MNTRFFTLDVSYQGMLQAGVSQQGKQRKIYANRLVQINNKKWDETFPELKCKETINQTLTLGKCLLQLVNKDLINDYNEKLKDLNKYKLSPQGETIDCLEQERLYNARRLVLFIVEKIKPSNSIIKDALKRMQEIEVVESISENVTHFVQGEQTAAATAVAKGKITIHTDEHSSHTTNTAPLPTIAQIKKACETYKDHLESSKQSSRFFQKREPAYQKLVMVNGLLNILNEKHYSDAAKRTAFNEKLSENSAHVVKMLKANRDTNLITFLKCVGVAGAAILGLAGFGVGAYFAGKFAAKKLFSVHGEEFVREVAPNLLKM